eukprot:2823734-Rhodomonas_salina.3
MVELEVMELIEELLQSRVQIAVSFRVEWAKTVLVVMDLQREEVLLVLKVPAADLLEVESGSAASEISCLDWNLAQFPRHSTQTGQLVAVLRLKLQIHEHSPPAAQAQEREQPRRASTG